MPSLQDASGFTGTPERLLEPATEAEIAQILRRASARGVPVNIAGALTGLAGGGVAQEGWALSLRRFSQVRVEGDVAIAGAGASLADVQAAARARARFYAPDPTEQTASVGGSLATNASGSRSYRYGATRRHVESVRVVLADGSVHDFRNGDPLPFPVPAVRLPQTTKHAAGYPLRPGMDWLDLLAGSEGTLAVIVEARLRLLPVPPRLLTGVLFFADEPSALAAVSRFRAARRLRMLEYMDRASLAMLRHEWPHIAGASALLVEEEAEEGTAEAWLDCAGQGIADSWIATTDGEREQFRRFRHALPEAINAAVRAAGLLKLGTDFAVPVERNGDMLRTYHEVLEPDFRGRYVIFGHVGDAHLHVNVLPRDQGEAAVARDLIADLARRAAGMGGSVAAEHGIGRRKRHLLGIQYQPCDIDAMRALKTRLDPEWILGRGTLFEP